MKQGIKKELKYIGRKTFGALIFVAVAGTGIWALAAFTEPTITPGNSVQDFAKNIMGANNFDNAFDSSDVIANRDGSVVERLENLENQVQGPTAISAEQANNNLLAARVACYNLSTTAEYAIADSNTSITYTDWYMPEAREMERFVGMTASGSGLWTATGGRNDLYHILRYLNTGGGSYGSAGDNRPYRCAR